MERTASCPSCRGIIFADDAFCSWCGERVQARVARSGESSRAQTARAQEGAQRHACESCQSPILRDDLYCANCGARCGVESTEQQHADAWAKIPAQISESSGGKYEFVRELGRGGMGIVFQARDKELKRSVAIKVLASNWLTDETMVARFQNEARTIASLKHESIVTVFEVRRAGNLHYFVMDYIEGASLSRVIRTHGPLPIPVIQAILYRVGMALSHAHRPKPEAVIHRDVKPSNIMLDPDGHVVVMDFGISKAGERPSGLTSTGLVMGTPEYMSPEQCRGHTVTPKSDQYALGTVVYAMLTGAPPFTGPFYQVLMAHQMEAVPSILQARPDCPPDLAAATERMLAKVPGDRWPSLVEMLKALGLKPLAPDDPVLEQIGNLVRTAVLNATPWPAPPAGPEVTPALDSQTPTSIKIVPHPDELEVGDEVALKATVLFQNGTQETRGRVTWESTNPSIVRIDPSTGQMVAVGTGSAMVTAVGDGVIGTLAVDVTTPRVAQVAIEPRDVTLRPGATIPLRARTKSKHGAGLERSVTWSSSDPRIATVTSHGVVTAKQTGTVSILAHCDGVGAAVALTVVAENEAAAPAAERPPVAIDAWERTTSPTPATNSPPPERMINPPTATTIPPTATAILPRATTIASPATPSAPPTTPSAPPTTPSAPPTTPSPPPAAPARPIQHARPTRPSLAGSRSYVKLAVIPAVLLGAALLAWAVLRPLPTMGLEELTGHLNRGEVLSVEVMEDELRVDVNPADGGSGTYRLSLAGIGVQTLLNDIDRRRIPIEAEGQGTVRVRTVTTGSGEPLPGSLDLVGSGNAAGCDPCDPNVDQSVAAGSYGVRPSGAEWRLDSIQVVGTATSPEWLRAGARLFVPNRATLDVVASLSSISLVDSARASSRTLRIVTQGLPPNARFSLDGQPLTRTDSVALVPGQAHRVVAEAQNRRSDTMFIAAQVGDTSWAPRLELLPAPPTVARDVVTPPPSPQWPDTFESPEAAIREFLRATESGMEGIEGVWSRASANDLQPWRDFLENKRIRTTTFSVQSGPTRRGNQVEFALVTVTFIYSSPPNDPEQRPQPLPLRFVLTQDGTRWRISQVVNLAAFLESQEPFVTRG
jgi:serine/threonine protein kinase